MSMHAASSSNRAPAGQVSIDAVTSAQRASLAPGQIRDRASTLAEARDELARLQGMLGASKHPKPPTRHPRESLAQLRAELEYLEGLDRKPTSYRLPPGDAELSLQILRFYDYTSAALEPQVLDFYVSAGGSKWRMRAATPPPSPKIKQRASELSVLRQQLAEIRQQQFSYNQQELMRSPSTPAALGISASGMDYISFGNGSSALKTPAPLGKSSALSPPSNQRTLELQRQLAAARAELEFLPH
jgi:hypothetical protein